MLRDVLSEYGIVNLARQVVTNGEQGRERLKNNFK